MGLRRYDLMTDKQLRRELQVTRWTLRLVSWALIGASLFIALLEVWK